MARLEDEKLNSRLSPAIIDRNHSHYPRLLIERLGKEAPQKLFAIGQPELICLPKTALFSSNLCPGDEILKAMDLAQQWRDQGRCIISGFHSPIEKECLRILLRGRQPVIICPARSMENIRIPKEWRRGIETGRILLLSFFEPPQRRITAGQSEKRNLLVASLADNIYFAHITPGGKTERLVEQVTRWKIPRIEP